MFHLYVCFVNVCVCVLLFFLGETDIRGGQPVSGSGAGGGGNGM